MVKEEKLRMCSNQKTRLPDMSGIDVMKEIKDIAPSVLVIIVTAYGDEEVAVDALRATPAIILRSHSAEPIHGAERTSFPSPIKPAQPGTPPSTVTLSQYHKIQQAVRYINDNYRTNIRLDAVAAKAGMSSSHFSRIFRKAMGLSYQEYLNSRRITKAKDFLRTNSRSVTEIAASLGFSDPRQGPGEYSKK